MKVPLLVLIAAMAGAAAEEPDPAAILARPSLVRLDYHDVALADVIDDIRKQTGLSLSLSQSMGPPSQAGRVNLREPAPIPFWQAVEQLGLKGARFQNVNPRGSAFQTLQLGSTPEWTFTSSSGPFRIALTGLHLHRDRRLIAGPWVRIDGLGQRISVPRDEPRTAAEDNAVRFFGGLDVMVEPRMWFTQEAPARLIEASDDLGQSLVPAEAGGQGMQNDGAHYAFRAGTGVTHVTTEFRLRPTDRPGRVAQLRGVVPVMLHVRRPEPMLVIPLAEAAGKTFNCDDAEFTVQSVRNSASSTIVAVTVKLHVERAGLPDAPDPRLVTARSQMVGAHQLALTDADGTVLVDSAGGGSGGGATPEVYRWTINSLRKGNATHLRYYGMLRARHDAAFEFRDVPLP